MNNKLNNETMTLKEEIKAIHKEQYINNIPYPWTFTHHDEIIPATILIKPGIKLEIIGCISDDGHDLMDGFIDKLTSYEILKHFKEKYCKRPELTEQLIKSIHL